jgi:hypothetical protein
VQLLPTATPRDDQAGVLQQTQVLTHRDAGHFEPAGQAHQGLSVVLEQLVEQRTTSGVGECLEHRVHDTHHRKPFGFLSRGYSPAYSICGQTSQMARATLAHAPTRDLGRVRRRSATGHPPDSSSATGMSRLPGRGSATRDGVGPLVLMVCSIHLRESAQGRSRRITRRGILLATASVVPTTEPGSYEHRPGADEGHGQVHPTWRVDRIRPYRGRAERSGIGNSPLEQWCRHALSTVPRSDHNAHAGLHTGRSSTGRIRREMANRVHNALHTIALCGLR